MAISCRYPNEPRRSFRHHPENPDRRPRHGRGAGARREHDGPVAAAAADHRQRRPAGGELQGPRLPGDLPGRRPGPGGRRAPALGRPPAEAAAAGTHQRHRPDGKDLRARGAKKIPGLPARRSGGDRRAGAARLQERYPGLPVAGCYCPFHGFENDGPENEKIISLLAEKKPAVLFTSLGFPKGIEWIARHQAGCAVPLAIEVGASFSFISGHLKRAPRWMQKRGLEWLWRLGLEPRRLWKRYLVRDMPFFYYLLRQKFAGK